MAFFNAVVAVPLAICYWLFCMLLYGWTLCGQIVSGLTGGRAG